MLDQSNFELTEVYADSRDRCGELEKQILEQKEEFEAECGELNARLSDSETQRLALDARLKSADERCLELDALLNNCLAELESIRRSETYRIGRLLTLIPRKIKALFRKIFKRS